MFNDISFDELNSINSGKRSETYEDYFRPMELAEEEERNRILLAEKFENNLFFVLALLFLMQQYDRVDYVEIQRQVEFAYLKSIQGLIDEDEYIKQYAKDFSQNFITSTSNHKEDTWYYSNDRAIFIAENESLTSWNHQDYVSAILNGKKHKQWVDIKDRRERRSHRKVGQNPVKRIDEPYLVGNSIMMYPKDYTFNPESKEVVNCRCTIKYF